MSSPYLRTFYHRRTRRHTSRSPTNKFHDSDRRTGHGWRWWWWCSQMNPKTNGSQTVWRSPSTRDRMVVHPSRHCESRLFTRKNLRGRCHGQQLLSSDQCAPSLVVVVVMVLCVVCRVWWCVLLLTTCEIKLQKSKLNKCHYFSLLVKLNFKNRN